MCVKDAVNACVMLLGPCLSCLDVPLTQIAKPTIDTIPVRFLHQNEGHIINPKTVRGTGTGSLFKFENCVPFHFPVMNCAPILSGTS